MIFTSPREKGEVIRGDLKSPHLTPEKSRWFENHLTSPQKKSRSFEITSPHLKKIELISKSPHLTSKKMRWFKNHLTSPRPKIEICCSRAPKNAYFCWFSVKKSPHLTSPHEIMRWFQSHLTSPQKKVGWFQNHLTSPQKNLDGLKITSPHLKKIGVIFKSPHLTSKKLRWF